MAKIHQGATLTPHFRDFVPTWLARQPWYLGTGRPSVSPVGYLRVEDPAGEVGIETHLVTDGEEIYQIPMTYRGAPLPDGGLRGADPLIATAEHSVLGRRWIYDGTADPVWINETLRLVSTQGVSESGSRQGVGPATARGRRLVQGELVPEAVTIELNRVLTVGNDNDDTGALGLLIGTWHPGWPTGEPVSGCLAVVRATDGFDGTRSVLRSEVMGLDHSLPVEE
ncbi:MAG TPA: hypothetical protein VGD43_09430 [Micromonospora sp.]